MSWLPSTATTCPPKALPQMLLSSSMAPAEFAAAAFEVGVQRVLPEGLWAQPLIK